MTPAGKKADAEEGGSEKFGIKNCSYPKMPWEEAVNQKINKR